MGQEKVFGTGEVSRLDAVYLHCPISLLLVAAGVVRWLLSFVQPASSSRRCLVLTADACLGFRAELSSFKSLDFPVA
jgi:hypothetical protein